MQSTSTQRLLAVALFGVTMLVTGAALAQPNPPPPRARIAQGVEGGSLTRAETRRLAREQRHIRQVQHQVRADGVVIPRERARVHSAQKRANAHIFKAKHNRRHR